MSTNCRLERPTAVIIPAERKKTLNKYMPKQINGGCLRKVVKPQTKNQVATKTIETISFY